MIQYQSSMTQGRTDIISPKRIANKHNCQSYANQARQWMWLMAKHAKQNLSHSSRSKQCPHQQGQPIHSQNSRIHWWYWEKQQTTELYPSLQNRRYSAQGTGRTHQNERKTYSNRSSRWPWPIPHSTDTTTRAMAYTMTIKESPACIGASKQRIRFTINGTGCNMDARGMRISSEIDMAESNKSRELCRVANPNQT